MGWELLFDFTNLPTWVYFMFVLHVIRHNYHTLYNKLQCFIVLYNNWRQISETMITPDTICRFRGSEEYLNFDEYQSRAVERPITKDLHTKIRNNVITDIILNNATRTGVIINMFQLQVAAALYTATTKCFVVEVIILIYANFCSLLCSNQQQVTAALYTAAMKCRGLAGILRY